MAHAQDQSAAVGRRGQELLRGRAGSRGLLHPGRHRRSVGRQRSRAFGTGRAGLAAGVFEFVRQPESEHGEDAHRPDSRQPHRRLRLQLPLPEVAVASLHTDPRRPPSGGVPGLRAADHAGTGSGCQDAGAAGRAELRTDHRQPALRRVRAFDQPARQRRARSASARPLLRVQCDLRWRRGPLEGGAVP